MIVHPVAGGRVRDPRTRAIITEAHEVPDNDFYWLTRIAHGDVTVDEQVPSAEPAEAAEEPAGESSEDHLALPSPDHQG